VERNGHFFLTGIHLHLLFASVSSIKFEEEKGKMGKFTFDGWWCV
jgi:hypothetical protein